LTEKGIKLRDSLTGMHRRHAEMLSRTAVSADDLQAADVTLRRLERFWIRAADLVERLPRVAVSSAPGSASFRLMHISDPVVHGKPSLVSVAHDAR
jgi:hypothetical protein